MKARRFAALGNLLLAAILMLAVWVLLVWVASRPALKTLIDLTPQRVNSVDPLTVELLRDLRAEKAEVEFHMFFPPLQGQAQNEAEQQSIAIRTRLADLTRILLRRYQWLGGEGITIHDHDFYRDVGSTRDAALAFDYKPAEVEVLVVAVRPAGRERRYRKLSLVTDLAVIDVPGTQGPGGPTARMPVPVLKDFRGEEAISSTLKSLLVQGSPVAYFLQGYSLGIDLDSNLPSAYGGFRTGLRQAGFELRDLDLKTAGAVPPDAALVIVLEPRRDFVDRDAEALFAYCKRGGRLFVNYSWAGLQDWNPTGGKLGELLGYELSNSLVCHMIPDRGGRTGGRDIDGPGVENLQLQGNPSHPVTRRLLDANRPLEVAGARALRERAGAPGDMRREPLLWTGDKGWLAGLDANGRADLRGPRIGLQSYTVGMSIEVDGEAPAAGAPAPRTGQVVLVSGVFCSNAVLQFFGDLAFNICNWMAERRVLLDIQGSRYVAQHLQLQPQQLDRIWWFLVVGVPGSFVALGWLVVSMRRRT